MGDVRIGAILLAVACLSVVLAFALVAGIVWGAVAMVRRHRRTERDRRGEIASALGLRIVDALRLEGRHVALAIELEEGIAPPTNAELAADLALLAVGGEATTSRGVTCFRATLPTPLPRGITLAHLRSGHVPRPRPGELPVPGHASPLADAVHRVHAEDVAWAASFLGELAARGGLADLEAGGWRVSFDRERVMLERDGSSLYLPAVRDGLAHLERVVHRLAPPRPLR